MTTNAVEVTITAPDPEWLTEFVRRLVRDRLCAAGHVLSPIRSLYWWEDEQHDTRETRVALHTRASLTPEIIERVREEHPFVVPCVVAVPFTTGNPEYLAWIEDVTKEPTVGNAKTA